MNRMTFLIIAKVLQRKQVPHQNMRHLIDPTVVRNLYKSFNQVQASIFYTVCQWCTRRVCGQSADQFFYFVTGGTGIRKSHLILCIYAET